jgi:hypothetical protein
MFFVKGLQEGYKTRACVASGSGDAMFFVKGLQVFEPRNVVLNIVEFSEMSAWLGQRYEDIWMQSSGTGNLPGVIVPKTRRGTNRWLDVTWSEMLVPQGGEFSEQ